MAIDIRDAMDADVPRLLEIRYAAFAAHAPSAYTPEQVETLLADVALHAVPFYLATDYEIVARRTDWDGSSYAEMRKQI